MGELFVFFGCVLLYVGIYKITKSAFAISPRWGFATLFLPFVWVILCFREWGTMKKSLIIYLAGYAFVFVGAAVHYAIDLPMASGTSSWFQKTTNKPSSEEF